MYTYIYVYIHTYTYKGICEKVERASDAYAMDDI